MYRFSDTSAKRLSTACQELQDVFNLAIKRSPIDFGIACGHRSVEEQQRLYAQGRTEAGNIVTGVDGITTRSEHNYKPSRAVDIYAYVNGKAVWTVKDLCFIGGVVFSCAAELGISIRWGGNWDGDGEILTDQRFKDLPHFELN